MLPSLNGARGPSRQGGESRKAVSLGAATYDVFQNNTELTKQQAVTAVSLKLINHSRDYASAYFSEVAMANEQLSAQPAVLQAERQARADARRAKRLAERRRRFGNPLVAAPLPNPRVGSRGPWLYGSPPPPPATHLPRISRVRADAGDGSSPALDMLKRTIADNMERVSTLLQRWDVDLDGKISLDELRDALGALQLTRGSNVQWNEKELSKAAAELMQMLDQDGSGTLEFDELHNALRQYGPPPLSELRPSHQAVGAELVCLEMPKRRARELPADDKDFAAVSELKRLLGENQARVIDLFRRWDYDADSTVSPSELRRALAALSIPATTRAVGALFRKLDADGNGEISFEELNRVLRRKVDFDVGKSERFDASTGKYVPSFTHVKQVVEVPAGQRSRPKPPREINMVATPSEPSIVVTRIVTEDSLAAARYAARRQGDAVRGAQMQNATDLADLRVSRLRAEIA